MKYVDKTNEVYVCKECKPNYAHPLSKVKSDKDLLLKFEEEE